MLHIIRKKSIKLNFVMNAILTMSTMIFPLITFPYVSRILLPIGTGKVSFATSVIAYFTMIAQLGIPTYGIRACANVRDNREELSKVTQELLIISIFMMIISYVIFGIALIMIPKLLNEKKLFLIMSSTILFQTIGMEWLYKGLEEYTYIAIRSIAFKVVALIGMFFLVKVKEDYIVYGGISIFAASASNVLNLINARKYITFKRFKQYNYKRHMKPILIFFAMACATTIYTNLDTVMLGFIKTDTDVGYYNSAVKVKLILVSIITSLGTVLLPRASYYIEHGMRDEFEKITRKALHFVVVAAIPVTFFSIIFAAECIMVLSGSTFIPAVCPMQWIMPTVFLIGVTNVLGIQTLVPLGKEVEVLKSVIIGACVDLVINLILIPQYGSTGAAIGTLLAEFAVLVYQLLVIRIEVKNVFKDVKWGVILVATLVCSIIGIMIKTVITLDILCILVGGISYFCMYVCLLLYKKESLCLEIFQMIISKLKRG